MKKFILLFFMVCALFFSVITVHADDVLNISALSEQVKENAEKAFAPVIKLMAGGLNAGLYAPVSGKVAAVGLQGNIVTIPKEGLILKDVEDINYLPMPFVYAGVRIPFIGINVLARGLIIPISNVDKYPTIIGLGIGWEPDLIPLFSTKVMLTYHWISNFPLLPTIYSLYPNITLAFSKIPFVTPYANVGLSYTKLVTDIKLPGESENFGMNEVYMHAGIGVKVFFVTVELDISPVTTYSISAGFSF